MTKLLTINQRTVTVSYKILALALAVVLVCNAIVYRIAGGFSAATTNAVTDIGKRLYLLDQASAYVYDLEGFEHKVRQVSRKLNIPAEWLMAVMHSESKFDASVSNFRGSGATGLIQFMPATARDFGITTRQLKNLSHVEQLDYVYQYLNAKQQQYRPFESLTDLYLSILYPKALGEDFCYTLYAKPSDSYRLNIGLDINSDGNVTVQDVDKYLKRKYPSAYVIGKPGKTPDTDIRMISSVGSGL